MKEFMNPMCRGIDLLGGWFFNTCLLPWSSWDSERAFRTRISGPGRPHLGGDDAGNGR